MKTLIESKKASVMEQKRFGKEFQTVYKFFGEENQKEKLTEKFPNKVKSQTADDAISKKDRKPNSAFEEEENSPAHKKRKDKEKRK